MCFVFSLTFVSTSFHVSFCESSLWLSCKSFCTSLAAFAHGRPSQKDGVLSCLTNFGVDAEELKLEGQRPGGGFTAHVIDVPPQAWSVTCRFTGARSVASGLPLVCCDPVGVCLQQSPRWVPAIPNLIPLKDQVLNMISEYLMSQTADILHNALVQSVDPNVVLVKRMRFGLDRDGGVLHVIDEGRGGAGRKLLPCRHRHGHRMVQHSGRPS